MDKYCRHGHEYTPENSYAHNGVVQCKECRRVNRNKSYRRYHQPVPPEVRWPKHSHCAKGHPLVGKNRMAFSGGTKCRTCSNEAQRLRSLEDKNGTYYRGRANHQMRKRYGPDYDLPARDALLIEQGSACPICGRTGLVWGKGYNDTWHTDHEHGKEGTHRGILCARCNTALGRLEPNIIKVIQYLVKWNKTELIDYLEKWRKLHEQGCGH